MILGGAFNPFEKNIVKVDPFPKNRSTLPETNSEFTPENGWLEDDPALLGLGLFSRASC